MAYANHDEVRTMIGIDTSELSSANLATLITIADRWVDNYAEGAPTSNDKKDAANCFACALAFQNRAGAITEKSLIELKDAIKIDVRTAQTLRQGLSKQFFDRALYILSAKTKKDLIVRVP